MQLGKDVTRESALRKDYRQGLVSLLCSRIRARARSPMHVHEGCVAGFGLLTNFVHDPADKLAYPLTESLSLIQRPQNLATRARPAAQPLWSANAPALALWAQLGQVIVINFLESDSFAVALHSGFAAGLSWDAAGYRRFIGFRSCFSGTFRPGFRLIPAAGNG